MKRVRLPVILFAFLGIAASAAEEPPYELSWRYVTGGQVVTAPATDHGGSIYVLSDDRTLYALSALGKERWRFRLGRKASTSPVIAYDGTILVGTESGILLGVGANGRLRWTFSPRTGSCLAPALEDDGSIILATSAGLLYCLSYTGREKWRYRVRAELSSSPSLGADGTIYLGTTDRRLLALNRNGAKKWEIELPARVGRPVIGPEGALYLSAAGIHRVTPKGALQWSYSIPADTTDPVLRADGAVIAGAGNGRLYAISPRGRLIWSTALRVPVAFPAALGEDGTAYVSTASRQLAAVSSGGRILWRFNAKQPVGAPSVGRDGTLIVGAEDWILYALSTASAKPAGGPWPAAYHDGQHTGRAGALSDLDSPAALLLRELVHSGSPELKRMALRDIDAHLQGRRYLEVHLSVLEELLGYLAGEGVIYRNSGDKGTGRSDTALRLEACRLLGELGSEGARVVLLQVMAADEDSEVKRAAVESLAAVGFDPDADLARAILENMAAGGNERLQLSYARALYLIIAGSQGRAHPDNYRALAVLAQGGVSAAVRDRASGYLRELSRLSRRRRM